MSGHLQRLLARVAPGQSGSAGLGLAAMPVNLPTSPLVETDQRIGMPEFSGLSIPVEASGPGIEVVDNAEASATTRASPASPRSRQPSSVKAANPTDRTVNFEPDLQPDGDPRPAKPRATQLRAPALPKADMLIADPARTDPLPVSQKLQNPFVIAPHDFEPAPIGLSGDEPQPADAPRRASQQSLAEPEPAPPILAGSVEAPAFEQLDPQPRLNARPLHAPAFAPLPAVQTAEPVRNERADAELTERALQPDLAEPSGGPVVIEQVVIEVVAPPTSAVAVQPAQSDARSQTAGAGPQTAEAASLIGPLPVSRPFAALYGMRRR